MLTIATTFAAANAAPPTVCGALTGQHSKKASYSIIFNEKRNCSIIWLYLFIPSVRQCTMRREWQAQRVASPSWRGLPPRTELGRSNSAISSARVYKGKAQLELKHTQTVILYTVCTFLLRCYMCFVRVLFVPGPLRAASNISRASPAPSPPTTSRECCSSRRKTTRTVSGKRKAIAVSRLQRPRASPSPSPWTPP